MCAMRSNVQQTNTVMRQPDCARGCDGRPAHQSAPQARHEPAEVKSAPTEALTANPRHAPLKKKSSCRLTLEVSGAGRTDWKNASD